MKFLILLACITLNSPSFASEMPKFIKPYLEIQTLLAKDGFAGIESPAKELALSLKAAGHPDAARAATPLQTAKTITEARGAFEKVSGLITPWAKKHKLNGITLAYCPMKKAYWLQAKGDLRNPYYGAEMLECGVVEDQK